MNPAEPIGQSDIGSKNNVISVKKTDFEVFDALDMDSINTTTTQSNSKNLLRPLHKSLMCIHFVFNRGIWAGCPELQTMGEIRWSSNPSTSSPPSYP